MIRSKNKRYPQGIVSRTRGTNPALHSQLTRFGHWPPTKSKGRGPSSGDTRNEFISVRPAPGRQWTDVPRIVSEVLGMVLSL